MKKLIDVFLLLCLFCVPVWGQNPNPQQSFVAQEQLGNPSLQMNFNDATTNFLDSVSGLSFGPNGVSTVGLQNGATAAVSAGYVVVQAGTLPSGVINSFTLQFNTAPTAGPFTMVLVSGTAPSLTLVSSFTVTVAATTAVQTFTAPTNFTAVTVTAGERFGYWASSTATPLGYNSAGGTGFYYVAAASSLPSGAQTYTQQAGPDNLELATGVAITGGIATTRQPGFDNTNQSNYSAVFPYNGFNAAPNNALGAIDWNVPWSMLLHIDRLNWNRTGTLVLASKGDSSSLKNNWWKLTLNAGAQPSDSYVCFVRNGVTTSNVAFAGNQICTALDTMPNGYNYDIVVTDNGAGTGAALDLYINGLGKSVLPENVQSNSFQVGFGMVNLTISGGTGYANTTAFTSSGGGANCNVSGSIPATSGVPTAGVLYSANYNDYNAGCTSLPTIALTSPTGTGMVVTPSLVSSSMNATNLPLMVPGAVSGGNYGGIDPTDSTQVATNVDEFAIFPGVLSATNIQSLYYLTNFYQGILGSPQHIPVIVNEIVCGDYDSTTTIAVAIRLHQLGYINLLGVGVENDSGIGAAFFRQMLDQAGLNNIPVAMASNSNTIPTGAAGFCSPANVTTYNASTPQIYTGYPTTSTMYRQIFAAHPTTAITLLIPTPLFGIYDFMNSAADGISSLTGAQLWAQNVTNGGSMYLEGGPDCQSSTLPATSPCANNASGDNSMYFPVQGQYVLNHLAGMPLYLMAGSPQSSGPGPLVTRASKDPLYLASATYGNDSRTAWDSLGTMMVFTGLFGGGVQIGYSGGTGYANATAFTSTGGGANCHVDGYMMASGGVPNGIKTGWGSNYPLNTFLVYGHGCTSAPTLALTGPTGTGVTLTAYPSAVCGTDTITQPGGVWSDNFTSATCSQQYVIIPSWQANQIGPGSGAPIYQWLLNSLQNAPTVPSPRVQ